MKVLVRTIKRLIHDVIDDLNSCKNRFLFLENRALRKHLLIFLFITLGVLGVVIFTSVSQAEFYLNFLKLLLVLLISFFVYCQSDCFWFLIFKAYLYNYNIKHRRHMKDLLDQANKVNFTKTGSVEGQILVTAFFNSKGYKEHAVRYIVEICIMLIILLCIMPIFFFYNLVVFGVMFVYVSLYEGQSTAHAFSDIIALINCIKELIKEDPKKCREFILESKYQEVKDLGKLYKFVLEFDKKSGNSA